MYEERRSTTVEAVVWSSVAAGSHLVLPDGCMDVLWWRDALVLAGPDTVAHRSGATTGEPVVGLRFDPGVLPALLGVPAHALTDQRVALGDVWDTARTRQLEEQLTGCLDAGAVETAIVVALGPETGRDDPGHARRHVVARIADGWSIAALAAETGWSERHLLRRSREWFGYGPTVLRRVLRLQRVMDAAGSGRPLAQVACDVGYSDQAHLSRDVRALTGTTIGALTR